MRVKTIVDEDFTNYKKPAMFIGTISCGGKCCIEAGIPLSVCQNDGWRASAPISIDDEQLCIRYLNNPLTESIVFGGLEPLEQLMSCVRSLRFFAGNSSVKMTLSFIRVTTLKKSLNGFNGLLLMEMWL